MKEDEVIKEFSVSVGEMPGVGVFKVVRSFTIKVKDGPPVPVTKGTLVELSAETAKEEFVIGRVIPYDPAIPINGRYKVVYPFRTVMDGVYTDLKQNDVIELGVDEAIPLLRENKITIIVEEEK